MLHNMNPTLTPLADYCEKDNLKYNTTTKTIKTGAKNNSFQCLQRPEKHGQCISQANTGRPLAGHRTSIPATAVGRPDLTLLYVESDVRNWINFGRSVEISRII